LGVVQGLTEWLPISSSGHLIVLEHFFGLATTPLFDVVLHVGTLVVVILFLRKEVLSILSSLYHSDFHSEYGRLIPLLIIATIPTGIIGLIYVEFFEDVLSGILPVGIAFILGGTIVYLSKYSKEASEVVTTKKGLIVGFLQGLAAFHGLSRMGVTISSALLMDINREKALRFSFLLSIPAILGDLLVEAFKQQGVVSTTGLGWTEMLVGVGVAMVVGYISLNLISRITLSKRFHYFAFYTWSLGLIIVLFALLGK
jgi:undecaprenyl-diphosphatase